MKPAKDRMSKKMRIERLQAELSQGWPLHIKEISRTLGVSGMTVRRDIQQNLDKFAYFGGYIVPGWLFAHKDDYMLDEQADLHREAKKRACRFALPYIHAGETVFVDCGTTVPYLFDLLPDELDFTVVCYALNVASLVARKPNLSMIMLGGVYHPSSATFFSADVMKIISSLGINVAIITAAGIDYGRGASCVNFHEAEIKRQIIAVAEKKILLLDSSKIGRIRPALFADWRDFNAIITENGEMSEPII